MPASSIERSYFETAPEHVSIDDIEADLIEFPRTVGEIHRTLVEAGFDVEGLLEPGSSNPETYREQWSHRPDLMAKIPPTLVVRAEL